MGKEIATAQLASQYPSLQAWFEHLDANGDGKIQRTEVPTQEGYLNASFIKDLRLFHGLATARYLAIFKG